MFWKQHNVSPCISAAFFQALPRQQIRPVVSHSNRSSLTQKHWGGKKNLDSISSFKRIWTYISSLPPPNGHLTGTPLHAGFLCMDLLNFQSKVTQVQVYSLPDPCQEEKKLSLPAPQLWQQNQEGQLFVQLLISLYFHCLLERESTKRIGICGHGQGYNYIYPCSGWLIVAAQTKRCCYICE